eukprot:snap_masked-scaffold_8-processed-gene-11.0-mRNA-1 protein AED:1.00 eAED:1.00 QI:0/0/0/0/1/1/2/0/72
MANFGIMLWLSIDLLSNILREKSVSEHMGTNVRRLCCTFSFDLNSIQITTGGLSSCFATIEFSLKLNILSLS